MIDGSWDSFSLLGSVSSFFFNCLQLLSYHGLFFLLFLRALRDATRLHFATDVKIWLN